MLQTLFNFLYVQDHHKTCFLSLLIAGYSWERRSEVGMGLQEFSSDWCHQGYHRVDTSFKDSESVYQLLEFNIFIERFEITHKTWELPVGHTMAKQPNLKNCILRSYIYKLLFFSRGEAGDHVHPKLGPPPPIWQTVYKLLLIAPSFESPSSAMLISHWGSESPNFPHGGGDRIPWVNGTKQT